MTDIEKLLAIEEIKTLRYKWSRFVDEGLWSELGQLLAPDMVLDLTATHRRTMSDDAPPIPAIEGADAVRRWMEENIGKMPENLHISTMPEITFLSEDKAEALWRQESLIPRAAQTDKCGVGYGTVHDRYRRIDGSWLIAATSVRIDLVL